MIKKDRLRKTFVSLVKIDSESRAEKKIARRLSGILERLGGNVREDRAARRVEGDCNNMVARFGRRGPFLMLNAHMDTVKPGKGVKPIVKGDIIKSDGSTVLGADCKSGIAIILEVLRSIKEDRGAINGVEVVFTVAEEIGLMGAKNIDRKLLKSKTGFALDSLRPETVIDSAPAANRIHIDIHGLESHAGMAPEKGISAVVIAADAVNSMKLGRIDSETTANIGLIGGGRATNIVPSHVSLSGEVRSHNKRKLETRTNSMIEAASKAAKKAARKIDGKIVTPHIEVKVRRDYPVMKVSRNSQIMKILRKAAKAENMEITVQPGGGGSDANIFNSMGIETIILGTGMTDVHSTRESIKISDMVKTAELLQTCVEIFAEGKK